MLSVLHHFPNAKILGGFLLNHRVLNSAYYQEKGITSLIAKLAANRFAGRIETESSLRTGVILLSADLQRGEDGFTGERLPKIELPIMHQPQFSSDILNALIESTRIQSHHTLN